MYKLKSIALASLLFTATFIGCSDDDGDIKTTSNFTVTIENTFAGSEYFSNGLTGFIMPGMSESHSFDAGKGHYLSFATMFVQSNDLFYAPSDEGLALYDMSGNPTTGDVTSMIDLWDAGTEVNEEPGIGPNQAPRQGAANTGADENGTVGLVADAMDGFTYPANSDIVRIDLSHDGGTLFTLTITNISNLSSLPSPLAPGVWVINQSGQHPLFTIGSTASAGLQKIAEDGSNEMMDNNLSSKSGLVSPFAPGSYAINDAVFTSGQSASSALEALAEDGDPSGFTNVFNTPVGASGPGPIFPGDSYSFNFSAEDGDMLSLATMLVQSNDWFVGASDINLFNNGMAISGDITNMIGLYDAGTEMDEYAGAGNNQPVRQNGANTGADENGTVASESNTGDHVPSIDNMVKVTISSN